MHYEYDPKKANKNEKKHSVSFEEAISIFQDKNLIIKFDKEHSAKEDKYIAIGYSKTKRCLFVVFCEIEDEYGETPRIISARCASKSEKEIYQRQQKGEKRIRFSD